MKQIIVGTYLLNYLAVELVLREGDGAEFYLCPEKGKCPRIKVGACGPWHHIVARLLHEAFELQLELMGLRYKVASSFTNDTGGVSFHFDHAQYSLAAQAVGHYVTDALPELAAVWRRKKAWHG